MRVRRTTDYRRIQRNGRRVRRRDLLALVLRNPTSSVARSRFGITVSRKVGGAVVRNRVKRWLREALRHEGQRVPDGWEVVFIAHRSSAEAGDARLRRQVRSVLRTLA